MPDAKPQTVIPGIVIGVTIPGIIVGIVVVEVIGMHLDHISHIGSTEVIVQVSIIGIISLMSVLTMSQGVMVVVGLDPSIISNYYFAK